MATCRLLNLLLVLLFSVCQRRCYRSRQELGLHLHMLLSVSCVAIPLANGTRDTVEQLLFFVCRSSAGSITRCDDFQMQGMDADHVSKQSTESRCGCTGRCGRQPSGSPALGQRRYYKSFAFLCVSFQLIFASFLSLQALQSSFNDVLGLISLAVVYIFFMVSCLLSPFVILVIGPRYVISACYLCHCIYIATNYYPSYYTLIPGSMVLGCASGPLWVAASVYMVGLAKEVARILQKEAAKYVSIFVGIFFLGFFLAAPVGNAIASAILLPVAGGLSAPEGRGGNASNSSLCMALNSSQEERDWPFYLLLSIYLLFDVSAFVMSLFGLVRISKSATNMKTCSNVLKQLRVSLSCVGRMLFNWRFLLLAPVCGYSGIHIAIFAGLFARVCLHCMRTFSTAMCMQTSSWWCCMEDWSRGLHTSTKMSAQTRARYEIGCG